MKPKKSDLNQGVVRRQFAPSPPLAPTAAPFAATPIAAAPTTAAAPAATPAATPAAAAATPTTAAAPQLLLPLQTLFSLTLARVI